MVDDSLHTQTHGDPNVEVAYDREAIKEWALWRLEFDSWQTEWDFPVPEQKVQEVQICMAFLNALDEIEKLKKDIQRIRPLPGNCTCGKPLLIGELLRLNPDRDYGPEHDHGCPASKD